MKTKKQSKTVKKKTKSKSKSKTGSKSKVKTMSKTHLSNKGYYDKPFLKYARMNLLDRKYCSCVMAVRHRKYKTNDEELNPYGVCTHNIYIKRKKKKSKKLDCGINYDLDNYHIDYIKAYAKERGIPLSYINKEGKRELYAKKTLINKLRKSIIDKKKQSKSN
jgi:hypothetical protein